MRRTVLGIEQSLSGRRWCARSHDDRATFALADRLGISELLARVLVARGVNLETADRALDPTLRALLPDPSTITDMDKAAERLADAIERREQIAVFGDYDVDGATSTALLTRFLRSLGADPLRYIPDRIAEGYGPNEAAMDQLAGQGAKLVVTVDCGTLAYKPLERAAALGMDLIVSDHHLAEPHLPIAHAVVNPNRLDDTSGLGMLAAVGVTFMLVIATNRALRERGYFDGEAEPNPLDWLDLVALGTVADVVPLEGLNRAFVTQGLKIAGRRANAGLTSLFDIARVDEPPSPYHMGYVIGPRVNAGGRVGEAGLGTELLICDDPLAARPMAEALDRHNSERRAIEAAVLEAAQAQAHNAYTGNREHAPLIAVADKGWHPGVIGIVASRIKDRFRRPSLVLSIGEDGLAKGSGRSVLGVDLGRAVTAALEAGLLVNGGGHKMAAGLTVEAAKIDALQDFLEERLAGPVREAMASHELGVDGVVAVSGATLQLIEDVHRAGPFGAGNPEPRFAIAEAHVVQSKPVGDGSHVHAVLSDKAGGRLTAIGFGLTDTPLGQHLLARQAPLHLAGHIRANHFNGRVSAQLIIEDGALI